MYRTAIFTLALFSGSAQAQPLDLSAAPEMVKMLSYSVTTGVKMAAKPQPNDTEEDAAINKCVQKLGESEFYTVIEDILKRRFSKAELLEMNAFMSTPEGKKYAKNRIHSAMQTLTEDAQSLGIEEFTQNEVKEIQKFLSTPLGVKLASKDGLWDEKFEKEVTAREVELLDWCVPGES